MMLIDELVRAERRISKYILAPNVKQAISAYQSFQDAVEQEQLTHYNQPLLNISIKTAKQRSIGSYGGWGYASINNEMSSDAIEAVSFAAWGVLQYCQGIKAERKQRILV